MRVELNRSRLTVEAYGRDLRQFGAWISGGAELDWDFASVTTADIRAWLGREADRGVKPVSLRRKTQSLRAFYQWALRRGMLRQNPAADVILAKPPKHLPEFAKESEIAEVLEERGDTFALKREHLAVSILYSLGLRQAELLALTDADVSHTAAEMKVTGKRNKQRVVPVPEPLLREIAEWQRLRDEKYPDLPRPRPLMAGVHGRISKETLYNMVHRRLAATSASKKSPHTLRHSFATAMLGDGGDLDAVREIFFFNDTATTEIYTELLVGSVRCV